MVDEYTSNYICSMTNEERFNMILDSYRQLRNNYLQKTDIYMYQIDRFSVEQLEQLKKYRQELRDMVNLDNQDKLRNGVTINFPNKPDFINLD